MRVTKFVQSCVVVEKDDGGRILVDPGAPALAERSVDQFGPIDVVLYTHQHYDHFERGSMLELLDRGAEVHANANVCQVIGDDLAHEVRDGEPFRAAGFEILPRDLPHMEMMDGTPGPPNTGFLFDGVCFHPGDGWQIEGFEALAALLPIAGPSMSFREAYRLLQNLRADYAVPIHYDVFTASPELFAERCDIADVTVVNVGETWDVPLRRSSPASSS